MIDLLQYGFMQNAVIAALLSSIACGIIGTYVVVKKIGFISGGIAHASFGGIGLGYYLGINPLLGLIPFSLASALGIGWLSTKARVSEDTAIGAFWATGMALGVLFIGLTPGYAPNLFSYLFGNILTVPGSDLLMILGLDLFIVLVVGLWYNELLALCFDEEYARVSGVRTTALYLLLLCLIALTVVILVRVVGIVMVIALLTIPAAIARRFSRNLRSMMIIASLLCALFTLSGLWISWVLDVASGASIIMVAAASFLAVHLGSMVKAGGRRG
ncbi:metal ABC transporter permease [Prosthecochloris sp. N3]|uniref:Metal ABC transporter permease n=1 Tax=Prosthecochloris ethylica TaxID=2743976 RepID=A0ABR9XRH3_9CHLB|nr:MULTISPECIES: metal ABC transporter permease [Prosthecochloris]MBF0586339.1 metal ABC transporter permease [Prosthecochloris ethylica]MBF0636443.1 metal ABC transporter permease [Prosthecochloris ethylica]NUK47617.1 metal ABC transporter permease [Prosthecochloris ethylica]RNA64149.1 metal ABC transporter permease [Prosthecochloris sp. ZM_2]